MNKYIPLIVTLAATIGATVLTPDVIAHHPITFGVLAVVAQVLHSLLPSIFGQATPPPLPTPQGSNQQAKQG